ncbi:28s ribosomal protein mitochondrial-like protein [Camponotus japonicus]
MFIQIRQKLLYNTITKYGKQVRYSTSAISEVKDEVEKTAEPMYLPIEEFSYKANSKRKKQAWHEKIKSIQTVEEKLFEFNMPRYYGWKSLLLNEHSIPYNSLSHAQYITRTHVIKEPGLPAYYNDVISTEQLDSIVQAIKHDIEDNIIFEYCIRRREHEIKTNMLLDENIANLDKKVEIDNNICQALIQKINRTMLIHLSSMYPHLLQAEIDIKPRLEASWFAGGVEPPPFMKQYRKRYAHLKDFVDDPVDLPVQYLDLDVPTFKLCPKVLTYKLDRRHLTNIPGFWPGDKNEFGFLSYHDCTNLQGRPKEYDDTFEALTVQAILASYSWLLSQACYQGFSTFNDITYPLITQTVITDGQWWSFCVYQLNTTLVHSEYISENPKRNICWITEPIKLFDKIENEKVHGLNEEVLKTLIKFYTNMPEERIGIDLKPYLGRVIKIIADIRGNNRRNWLEKQYKHLVCNRPRDRQIPEIYDWQKIYLIRHKTRPMDKKREPWEYGIRMFKRRLDDHLPVYIPRCLRTNPKKRKVGRWAETYYP